METKTSCEVHSSSLCLRSFFLGRAQNRAQPPSDDNFFSGPDRHGNQFDVIGRLMVFFLVWLPFVYRAHQAWIVRPKHFDNGIARPEFIR